MHNAQRIQTYFPPTTPQSTWKVIKCITDYTSRDAQCPRDPTLPDALNNFFAQFKDSRTSPSTRLNVDPHQHPYGQNVVG